MSSNNEVNKVVFVDNLEVSFLGNIPTLTDSKIPYPSGENKVRYYNTNCFVEFRNNSNKFFRNICDLWIDGRKVGEFRFLPTSPFINDELINFKFENVQLYQSDFNRYIDYIIETFEFKYQYISHLDIAIDCIDHNLLKFVNNYLYYSNTNNYSTVHKGRLDKKNIVTNNQNIIHWGKLDSEKYIKIYNKTLELSDTNNSKTYIPVCWKQNKMIVDNKIVERFELTLKQKHTKKLDYKQLNDSNYLASIVKKHCLNYFQFVKTTKNNNRTYLKDVTPLSFNNYNTVLIPKFKHIKAISLYNEKRELKVLTFQFLLAKHIANDQYVKLGITKVPNSLTDFQSYKQSIDNILYTYPTLNDYYHRKEKSFINEFNNSNEIKRGVLSIDEYVQSIALTQQLEFNVEPENTSIMVKSISQLIDTYNENEQPEIFEHEEYELTEKQKKNSYRLTDLKLNDLTRSCKNANLKQIANKSVLIKKTSYEITNDIDNTNRLNQMRRKIA